MLWTNPSRHKHSPSRDVTKHTAVNSLPEHQPRQRPYSARHEARLDEATHAKLEELGQTFHRKRAPILRFVMQWGLTHTKGWTVDASIPASTCLVPLLVTPELLQQIQAAADRHGVSVAAWLRHAMRQVTLEDFPASWRTGETAPRSRASGDYRRKYQVRLDAASSAKLE
jgi:predicted transcriptional regulator